MSSEREAMLADLTAILLPFDEFAADLAARVTPHLLSRGWRRQGVRVEDVVVTRKRHTETSENIWEVSSKGWVIHHDWSKQDCEQYADRLRRALAQSSEPDGDCQSCNGVGCKRCSAQHQDWPEPYPEPFGGRSDDRPRVLGACAYRGGSGQRGILDNNPPQDCRFCKGTGQESLPISQPVESQETPSPESQPKEVMPNETPRTGDASEVANDMTEGDGSESHLNCDRPFTPSPEDSTGEEPRPHTLEWWEWLFQAHAKNEALRAKLAAYRDFHERIKLELAACVCDCGAKWSESDLADLFTAFDKADAQ